MEFIPKPYYASLKRYWRRKRYQRLDGTATPSTKKNIKVIKLHGGGPRRRFWRIKAVPKLRLKIVSPLKIWRKFKNGYIEMMVNLAGKVGYLNDDNIFGRQGISKAPQGSVVYSMEEVEKRLVYEIYKALMATSEPESSTRLI